MGKGASRKKAMRKGHYRQWSDHSSSKINTGQGPKPHALSEYRSRTQSLQQPSPIPETSTISLKALAPDHPRAQLEVAKSKLEVQTMRQRWAGTQRQAGYHEYNYIKVRERPSITIFMFFSGDKFFFVKEDRVAKIRAISYIYLTKERALLYLREGLVRWSAKEPMNGDKTV